jgi:hypothetical protein
VDLLPNDYLHREALIVYDFTRIYGRVIERMVTGTLMVSFFGQDGRQYWTQGEGPVTVDTRTVVERLLCGTQMHSHAGRIGPSMIAVTCPIRNDSKMLGVVVLHARAAS